MNGKLVEKLELGGVGGEGCPFFAFVVLSNRTGVFLTSGGAPALRVTMSSSTLAGALGSFMRSGSDERWRSIGSGRDT